MALEFLGSKLSDCSSLVYLGNSEVFYSSRNGDSYKLRLHSDHTGVQDQPHITIIETFESLAPIVDVRLRNPSSKKGVQNQLMLISGLNHTSSMTILKRGDNIRSLADLSQIKNVMSFYSVKDMLFVRLYGYNEFLTLKISAIQNDQTIQNDQSDISIDGVETPRCLKFDRDD